MPLLLFPPAICFSYSFSSLLDCRSSNPWFKNVKTALSLGILGKKCSKIINIRGYLCSHQYAPSGVISVELLQRFTIDRRLLRMMRTNTETVWVNWLLHLLRGGVCGVRGPGGPLRGQYLPHTCWERCTTISPSRSGSCGRPRSSGPPRCRLPPPERERKKKHSIQKRQRVVARPHLSDTSYYRPGVGAWCVGTQTYFTPLL